MKLTMTYLCKFL